MVRGLGFGVLGVSLMLGGCHVSPIKSAFDPAAAAYINKKGKGKIEGQAFLRRDYGKLVTAAGERVFLIPATRYTIERFSGMFGGDLRSYFGNEMEAPPEDYYSYRKETKVDMYGKFEFPDLSPGPYIVATRVFWTEPRSYLTRGGAIYDIVDVRDGETTEAIISGK